MRHGIEVAEENSLRRDPQVDKQIKKRVKMAKANEDKLRTDIATGKKIITQMYRELPPHARVFVGNAIMFVFELFFGPDFDLEKEKWGQ